MSSAAGVKPACTVSFETAYLGKGASDANHPRFQLSEPVGSLDDATVIEGRFAEQSLAVTSVRMLPDGPTIGVENSAFHHTVPGETAVPVEVR